MKHFALRFALLLFAACSLSACAYQYLDDDDIHAKNHTERAPDTYDDGKTQST